MGMLQCSGERPVKENKEGRASWEGGSVKGSGVRTREVKENRKGNKNGLNEECDRSWRRPTNSLLRTGTERSETD